MYYCLICSDKPDSLPLRLATREAHLKYWADADVVRVGGPFLGADEASPNGSLLVIEAESHAEAVKFAEGDPYNVAGLFASIEVRAWRWLLPAK